MAEANLQSQSVSALALELEVLHERMQRMESLLAGAESILSTIRYDTDLSYTPADDSHADPHRRAYRMIQFLTEQLEDWREREKDMDLPSDDIWELMDRAKHGRLLRRDNPVPA